MIIECKHVVHTYLDCGDALSDCMVSASVRFVDDALLDGRYCLPWGLTLSELLLPSRSTLPRVTSCCSVNGLRRARLRGGSYDIGR